MPHIRLLHNRILVRKVEPPKRIGLIWIPDAARDELLKKATEGIVSGVGPGRFKRNSHTQRHPMPVKVGDRIWFHQAAGDKGKHDGEEYLFLWSDEVWAMRDECEEALAEMLSRAPAEALKELVI